MLIDAQVRVRVPATSANLGPGYDSFGLAFTRYDTVLARVVDGPMRIEVSGRGADSVSRGPDHLVYRTAQLGLQRLGQSPVSLELLCQNEIPHGGGQGSSAAAIVAGLAVARELTVGGRELMSDQQLLDLASTLEGHPDNAAPAVLGGFTLAWTDGCGGTHVVRRDVDPRVRIVLFGALRGSSTASARAMLPSHVPHADAAANSAAAGLLLHALSQDPDLLFAATVDRLHQQYRAPAMPDTAQLLTDLRSAGIAAVVSGAGPSVLAFVVADPDEDVARRTASLVRVPDGFEVTMVDVDRTGLTAGLVAR